MSLRYANGFDALTGTSSDALRAYMQAEGWYFGGNSILYMNLVPGVFGGSAITVSGGAGIGEQLSFRPFETGPISDNPIIIAARMTYPLGNPSQTQKLVLFQGTTQVLTIDFTTVGRLRAVCNGTTALSRVGLVTENGTGMMSAEYDFDTGGFLVKWDGDTVIEVSSTTITGITYIDSWGFNTYWYDRWGFTIDDVYVIERDGVVPNDHLGNVRARSHLVVADGDVIELDPVNAATNYEAVQSPLMTKTSYVTTGVIGDYDLYQLADGSNARIIYGVAVRVGFYQGDATQLRGSAMLKTEGVEYQSADVATQSSPRIYSFNWGNNPNTNIAWTNIQINSVQVGGKLVSSD